MAESILTSKFCNKCSSTKLVSDFSRNKNRHDGLNGYCKSCVRTYSVNNEAYRLRKIQSHVKNKDHNNKRTAEWRENNKEYAKQYMAEWIKDNKHVKAASDKAWRISNRDYIKVAYKSRMIAQVGFRRAAKERAIPKWADRKSMSLIYKEAQEIRKMGILAEVDHIVPLRSKIVCGLHVTNNLQIITKIENLQKGNRFWPSMP